MATLQIVLLSVIGGFTLLSIIFMIMFIVEITVTKNRKCEEVEVKSIFSSESYVNQKNSDVDDMLAKLDEQAKVEVVSTEEIKKTTEESKAVEEKKEDLSNNVTNITNNVNEYNIINVAPEQKPEIIEVQEAKVEDDNSAKEEVVEEKQEEVATKDEKVVESKEENLVESIDTNVEDATEEVKTEKQEVAEVETVSNEENNEVIEVSDIEVSEVKPVSKSAKSRKIEETTTEEYVEEITTEEYVTTSTSKTVVDNTKTIVVGTTEQISNANLLDYKSRLEKIIENKEKLNKDLIKIEKSILNYERTKRRKNRNQKMLDRRASELTNLNLIMYSVTDIKNVDEDKKAKQEELTSHIAELKASIQDADEFLDSNKEKNEHDVKMAKFLIQEKSRYNEEIVELQKLIAKTEGTSVA